MKLFPRIKNLAAAASLAMAIVGCAENNEAALNAQARATAGQTGQSKPPPKNQDEYGQQQKNMNPYTKANGYPKAR